MSPDAVAHTEHTPEHQHRLVWFLVLLVAAVVVIGFVWEAVHNIAQQPTPTATRTVTPLTQAEINALTVKNPNPKPLSQSEINALSTKNSNPKPLTQAEINALSSQ
ncbi:MAG: hypothetical protein B7X04_04210 [Parcubacteria group bacterium 21-54-25]|nr:MAG: hypothetical protein B7X04_04210 [Parcubacteria group bacterium 21-54-25]HQU08131.1 hypothetical protein [Candidatus Paceibacterota bacterium]